MTMMPARPPDGASRVASVGLDLVLTGVRKRYGATWVVDGASFVVSAGRCTALLGPSGCGKSTLLRLILGLLHADAGSIQFGGRDAVSSDLRGRTGYVIQDGGLFPHLTAAENLALKARDLGWPSARIADRIREVLAISHFPADLLGHYPLQLSGGQRQRVGLMRALMLDPDLLLLDEPLAALDPVVRAELQDELRSVFRTLGKTVLFVTHDLAEAAFLADEIVLLRSGRVVQSGPWRDLVERPADDFVRQFVRAQRALHLMDGAPS